MYKGKNTMKQFLKNLFDPTFGRAGSNTELITDNNMFFCKETLLKTGDTKKAFIAGKQILRKRNSMRFWVVFTRLCLFLIMLFMFLCAAKTKVF